MSARRKKPAAQLPGPALKRAITSMQSAGFQIARIEFNSDGTFNVIPREQAEKDTVISGTIAIARALGVAAISVRRMVKDGRLKVTQIGTATSPFKARQSEIDRVLRLKRR